jgi:hypothetical protein
MPHNSMFPSKTALQLAFGSWLMRRAVDEVQDGFPRLRAVPDRVPLRLLYLIEKLSAEDQVVMLNAQIKSRMNPPPARPGVPLFELDAREKAAIEQFEDILKQPPQLREIAARRARGEFHLPKGALKRTVKATLGTLLGQACSDASGEVRYVTHAAGVTVYTDVDFGSKSCQMRYEQHVLRGTCDGSIGFISDLFLLRAISLMNLAGSGSTTWTFLTPDDIPGTAELLGQVCIEFIEAVPRIIEEARTIMT